MNYIRIKIFLYFFIPFFFSIYNYFQYRILYDNNMTDEDVNMIFSHDTITELYAI